jgi:hypothetical protein
MTTVATRAREIAVLEGFDIIVKRNSGRAVDVKKNGVLGPYAYKRALKGAAKTVKDWKKDRFEKSYPGYTCDVLDGNGIVATPQTLLKNVRATY